jgi:uncharacterized protein
MMNPTTQTIFIKGPVGQLEVAINLPASARPLGIALIAHPNPVQGGTMEHKIVHTIARSFLQMDYATVRFNYRGVGKSEGEFDQGIGETDDAHAVLEYAQTHLGLKKIVLAGFSFGGFIQVELIQRLLAEIDCIQGMILIGPAVGRFPIKDLPPHLPCLILQGEDDDIILVKDVLAWAKRQKRPVVVFPDCGHFFHGRLADIQNEILQRRAVYTKQGDMNH